jgi:hypothetical protein
VDDRIHLFFLEDFAEGLEVAAIHDIAGRAFPDDGLQAIKDRDFGVDKVIDDDGLMSRFVKRADGFGPDETQAPSD